MVKEQLEVYGSDRGGRRVAGVSTRRQLQAAQEHGESRGTDEEDEPAEHESMSGEMERGHGQAARLEPLTGVEPVDTLVAWLANFQQLHQSKVYQATYAVIATARQNLDTSSSTRLLLTRNATER